MAEATLRRASNTDGRAGPAVAMTLLGRARRRRCQTRARRACPRAAAGATGPRLAARLLTKNHIHASDTVVVRYGAGEFSAVADAAESLRWGGGRDKCMR